MLKKFMKKMIATVLTGALMVSVFVGSGVEVKAAGTPTITVTGADRSSMAVTEPANINAGEEFNNFNISNSCSPYFTYSCAYFYTKTSTKEKDLFLTCVVMNDGTVKTKEYYNPNDYTVWNWKDGVDVITAYNARYGTSYTSLKYLRTEPQDAAKNIIVAPPDSTTPSGTSHAHSWQWVSEGNNHYQKCIVDGCDATQNNGVHSGGTATCQTLAVCETCGLPYGDLGNHNYSTDYSKDATGHFHVCQTPGCGLKDTVVPHVYDDDTDTDCNVCGWTRTITPVDTPHTHVWDSAWVIDEAYHWHVCSATGCDGSRDHYEEHVFDGDICKLCGYKKKTVAPTPSIPAIVEDNEEKESTVENNEEKKSMVVDNEEKKSEAPKHEHSYVWYVVTEASASGDGLELLQCSCGDVKERSVIPASQVYVRNLRDAIKNAPANGTASYDSKAMHTMSDYIIKRLAERTDITTVIDFKFENVDYTMTIPAGVDYTAFFTDKDIFYGYFCFAQLTGATIVEK